MPHWIGIPAGLALLVLWCAGVGVPVVAVLGRASGTKLLDEDVLRVARLTASQAGWSVLFSVAIGLPLGLAAARVSPRVARWLDALLVLPQGVPTVVAATAWVAWLGRSGPLAGLDWAYSLKAVIVAHLFFNAPWVALAVAQTRRTLPQETLDAAATLGAGALARFGLVVWPQVRWACAAAAAQAFSTCVMSFALVLILGGGPPVETLETALYSRLRGGALDLSGAAACAVWQVGLTIAPWVWVLTARTRSGGTEARARLARGRLAQTSVPVSVTTWAALVLTCAFVAPYLIVLSGAGSYWGRADFWREALSPLRLSLWIAALAGSGAVLAAASALVAMSFVPRQARTWIGALIALPGGLSILVLGLGTWLAYGRWIDPFEGSLVAIVGLQVVVFMPIAFRLLWPVAQATQKRELEAAWMLGASPWRAFWLVDWPRWRAPVLSALALVMSFALGEVAAVSLFYSQELIPLPLLVSRWMIQYRFDEARALSALLLLAACVLSIGVSVLGERKANVGSS